MSKDISNYIIGMVIAILIFGALIGTIADNTIGRQGVGNVTGATSVMLGLIPIILIAAVVMKAWKK